VAKSIAGGTLVFGVYGLEFTRPCVVDKTLTLVPLLTSPQSVKRAREPSSLQLTGYGEITTAPGDEHAAWERVRVLSAAMTFAQQQLVMTSTLIEISPDDTVEDLMQPARLGRPLPLYHARQSFGPAIVADTWSPMSLCSFLNRFVSRFAEEVPDDSLRLAFFRQLEIWRLQVPYVEIHHFLAFSALELLARDTQPQYRDHRNAAVPISKLLQHHGFEAKQSEIEDWCRVRNRAFHSGEFVASGVQGRPDLRLTEQLFPLTQVLCDVLLKRLPFDDGHINWNRWRDRQPFC